MKINIRFFTTIQGIILIMIIALFAIAIVFGFLNSRSSSNDQKRLSDIAKIQAALKTAYSVNGFYPDSQNSQPKGIDSFLDFWPQAPSPDGGCNTTQNTYSYSQRSNGSDYAVTFCLGSKQGNLSAGTHTASSGGIE